MVTHSAMWEFIQVMAVCSVIMFLVAYSNFVSKLSKRYAVRVFLVRVVACLLTLGVILNNIIIPIANILTVLYY